MFKNFKPRKSNSGRLVDKKWNQIFEDYKVLSEIEQEGKFRITSKEINKYREARLMTKFDYVSSLPDVFYNNHLTILPTKRGEYLVGHFDAYYEYESPLTDKKLITDRKEMPFPEWIESLDTGNITSEGAMLNAALAGNLVNDLFNEDNNGGFTRTVDGRMSSLDFSFDINNLLDSNKNYRLNIENSQMEIDGGYEGHDKLLLFEAKNNITDSFIIRQLYYPFQRWAKEVDKEVIPIFLQYSNNTYNFSVFKFDDVNDYNSLRLVKRKNYIFGEEKTTLDDLVKIAKEVKFKKEPKNIPTPQADSIIRIYGLIDSIWESESDSVTAEEISLDNDFTYRQVDYYTNAAIFLELVIKDEADATFSLSRIGEKFIKAKRRERNLIIAKQLLQYRRYNIPFKKALDIGVDNINGPIIYKALVESNYYELTQNTYGYSTRRRRVGTTVSWIKHLFSLVG